MASGTKRPLLVRIGPQVQEIPLHHALRDAFGHESDHPYGFEIEDAEIHAPQGNCDCAKPDETHLPELANEPGQSFRYRYGLDPAAMMLKYGLEDSVVRSESTWAAEPISAFDQAAYVSPPLIV